MLNKLIFTSILFLLIWTACHHATEQIETQGAVQGTVWCLRPGGAVAVYPAYIFLGDTYLTTTDTQGIYRIETLKSGIREITGSALFCGDTTLSVQVKGGGTVTLDFTLTPDSTTGKVFGEFQDGTLFQQRLREDPSMKDWNEKYMFDAATGATLQYKTLNYFVPDRFVFLGDSLMATADNWGQYWLTIPSGTYPLTGSCEGYESVIRVVNVQPDSRNYLNFILPRIK